MIDVNAFAYELDHVGASWGEVGQKGVDREEPVLDETRIIRLRISQGMIDNQGRDCRRFLVPRHEGGE